MAQQLYYTKMIMTSNSKSKTSYIKYDLSDYTAYRMNDVEYNDDCCDCYDPCCDIKISDCCISKKKWNCCFLRGKVLCEFDKKPVPDAIVLATRQSDGKVFSGVTNKKGEYCICVPKGDKYTIECFLCCEDCFTSVPCSCGEANTCF